MAFDPDNAQASDAVAAVQNQVQEARKRIVDQRQTLDLGTIAAAENLLRDTQSMKSLISEYAALEQDLASASQLLHARDVLKSEDSLGAAEILASPFVMNLFGPRLQSDAEALRGSALSYAEQRTMSTPPGSLVRARAIAPSALGRNDPLVLG